MNQTESNEKQDNFAKLRGPCHPLAFKNARVRYLHVFRMRHVLADTLDSTAETGSVETIDVYWRSQCLHCMQQTPLQVYPQPDRARKDSPHSRQRRRKKKLTGLFLGVEERNKNKT